MTTRLFDDVVISEGFIRDYDDLPKKIKRKIDRRVKHWSLIGFLPPSAQAHRVHKAEDNIWICYVSCGKGSYRMLVEFCDHKLLLHRVQDHEGTDKTLRFS